MATKEEIVLGVYLASSGPASVVLTVAALDAAAKGQTGAAIGYGAAAVLKGGVFTAAAVESVMFVRQRRSSRK